MISLKKVLEVIHTPGEVFSLKVVSYDRRRKDKTGVVQEYAEAQLLWGDGGSDRVKGPSGERPLTDLERSMLDADAGQEADSRKPNHQVWYTRNIRLLQHGQPTAIIKKIHPPLIIEFNGQVTCP